MSARRLWTTCITLAALLCGCGASASSEADAIERAKQSGRSVPLGDGRTLFLRCTGRGSPTVLLEPGYGATSQAWYAVQPAVARTTRVCSYDRAGSGFSDAGPEPRDGASIARDLDTALTAARIEGPFIVVGHSAGGLYGRLFAARRAADVQGLVLLDPTVERRVAQPSGDGLDGLRRAARNCLAVSELRPQPPLDDTRWAGCVGAKPDPWAAATARRPDAWRSRISELDNLYGRTSDQVFRIGVVLRPIPTYVITAGNTAAAGPKYGSEGNPRSAVEIQHEIIARRSIEGSQQTVRSSHMIMFDRPEVVIRAVEEMVRASRAGRAPARLPPSETDTPLKAADAPKPALGTRP